MGSKCQITEQSRVSAPTGKICSLSSFHILPLTLGPWLHFSKGWLAPNGSPGSSLRPTAPGLAVLCHAGYTLLFPQSKIRSTAPSRKASKGRLIGQPNTSRIVKTTAWVVKLSSSSVIALSASYQLSLRHPPPLPLSRENGPLFHLGAGPVALDF